MNRLNTQLCSMTRGGGGGGVHEPLPAFLYPLTCGVSSLLPKKSTFQITRVIRKCSEQGSDRPTSPAGDRDVPNSVGFRILNPPTIFATANNTLMSFTKASEHGSIADSPLAQNSTVTGSCLPLSSILKAEIKCKGVNDVQSRFRIVKIESKEQFKRGRWTCRDFADPPEAKSTVKTSSGGAVGTIDSAATKSVYYVPGVESDNTNSQFIFYSEGHPVLESEALPADTKLFAEIAPGPGQLTSLAEQNHVCLIGICSTSSTQTCCSTDTVIGSLSQDGLGKTSDVGSSIAEPDETSDVPITPMERYGDFDAVLWKDPSMELNRKSLLSLISSSESRTNMSDNSATSLFEIDNKIEQAMDLVKTHLMFAVRAEVEELKERIKELMVKNSQLEYENGILRAAASRDVLSTLDSTVDSLK